MDASNCKQMMWQMAQKEKLGRNNDGTYSLPDSPT
jgi:hypothetical protein